MTRRGITINLFITCVCGSWVITFILMTRRGITVNLLISWRLTWVTKNVALFTSLRLLFIVHMNFSDSSGELKFKFVDKW
jgi:hypothetical protein